MGARVCRHATEFHATPKVTGAGQRLATRQLDIVKTGDGVGFRPEPDAATLVTIVSYVHNLRSVQEDHERIAAHIDAQLVPDAVHHLCSGAFQLAAPSTYIGEEDDVVLERVRPHDVVIVSVLHPEYQSASLVLLSRDRFEACYEGQIGVWLGVEADRGEIGLAHLA